MNEMTRALVTIFHQPEPQSGEHYLTHFDVFSKLLMRCIRKINKAYIIDSGWNLEENKQPFTSNKIELIKAKRNSHWGHLNNYLPQIKEDLILLVDSDTLIYGPDIVSFGFRKLRGFDVAAILDNSGGHDLFPANANRDIRRRIAPYFCFIRKKSLIDPRFLIDFTPASGEFDSMGRITQRLVDQGAKIYEFQDDRNTLRMDEEDHLKLTLDTWLDGPGFKWSEPGDKEKNLGYYHVRNLSTAISLLNEWSYDREAYKRRKNLMPFSEAMRLLAWQWIYDKCAHQLYHKWRSHFLPVLEDYGVTEKEWLNYIEALEKYHSWIKNL